ncbi:PEP/pyruvate-binding domain-containing protein [Dongia sp.]|uniref:PEP/pyruvate-binding domain-containing protein n=1 Tax=Dongia sp. TaxID=1977262 RepID=UPI0035AE625C
MKPKIYPIDSDTPPPAEDLLPEVGNKAFNLMRLAALDLPVPPAFVLSTGFCRHWIQHGHAINGDLPEQLLTHVRRLENLSGLSFGDQRRPLLLSVRSGAAASMPGMMETLLNIGLTTRTLPGLIAVTGKPRLAWDSLRRLVQSFAEVVKGVPATGFDALRDEALGISGAEVVGDLDTLALRTLTLAQLHHFHELVGEPFPEDPMEQLTGAVEAVFRSWESERAVTYRRLNNLDGLTGTAVTIQRMVFGNAGSGSGSGVGFTRNPADGSNELYMEFLFNAQGEDVVSGRYPVDAADTLQALLPDAFQHLMAIRERLELAFGDVQDFEFTIENGKVFLLQTRRAKRTDWAAVKIAVDLARQGLIEPREAVNRLGNVPWEKLTRRRLLGVVGEPLATAKSAGIGVASGRIALTAEAAVAWAGQGVDAILVRNDTTTDDIAGMNAAVAILTAHGGRTSHEAVIARQLNKVCLVGCDALSIAPDGMSCAIGGHRFSPGDFLTLDGDNGVIYAGRLDVGEEKPDAELAQLNDWLRMLSPAERPATSSGGGDARALAAGASV